MKKITFKFKFYKFFFFISTFFLSITNSNAQSSIVTGVSICKGGSGALAATSISKNVTTFSGHWNIETDPIALFPDLNWPNVYANSTICSFNSYGLKYQYTITKFVVTVSGTYDFKMTDNGNYDGTAYIYSGNFTPGSCEGDGQYIIGDDDFDGRFKEPHMTPYLEAGTAYFLVSQFIGIPSSLNYTWKITAPIGGSSIVDVLNYWYTTPTGGNSIGWGETFNPVGVPGSGLVNTNTAGKTTYYVSDGNNKSPRAPVDFIIKEDNVVSQISLSTCLNTEIKSDAMKHVFAGSESTGIETTSGLPSGLTASFSDNTIRIYGTPTETGEFNYRISLKESCDVATGKISISPKPADVVTNETICSGTAYEWIDGKTYTNSGIYKITNDGCTADQILNLTVTAKPADIIKITDVCEEDLNPPAKRVNDGCTADIVYKYNYIPKPADVETNQTICSGTAYNWSADGKTYTNSGIYKITNGGCAADQILNLTVMAKPADAVTNETICSGTAYEWIDGQAYTSSGIYKITNDGCTADQILNLTVTAKPADVETNQTICSGTAYNWSADGKTYTNSGIYKITNGGCAADQILNLTVTAKPADVETNETICSGTAYEWIDGQAYTASGIYKKSNDGCTADQILNLTVTAKPADVETNETICSGTAYNWSADGKTYTNSGIYKITNGGCAADQILNLTVTAKPADVVTNETICSGTAYEWIDGQAYTSSGIYKITNDGCTADQILNLTVTAKPADVETNETICSGTAYNWSVDGKTYINSGTYKITNDNCTADQILNLTVTAKPADVVTNEKICSGTAYNWSVDGKTYTNSGIYKITNDGCTADQILNLTVMAKPAEIIKIIDVCEGELNPAIERVINDGCTADIVYKYNYIPKPADVVTIQTICSGTAYEWINGQAYTSSGTYKITNGGCTADLVLILTVTTKPADVVTNETINPGRSYTWPANNITYTTAQNHLKIINNGCTADQILNLTVSAKPANVVTNAVICAGGNYTWAANNISYTTAQTGLKILGNANTADQILNLVVSKPLSAVVLAESILSEICEGDRNTQFSIEISEGLAPYSVAIDDENFISISGVEHTFENLSGGSHIVYIKDNLNCTFNLDVMLPNSVSINPVASIQYNCVDNLPSNSVIVDINPAIINASEVDYTLDGNSATYQSSPIFTNISPGTHFIRARHTNACEQDTSKFTIKAYDPLVLTLSNTELNEISAIASGGNGDYKYSFEGESFSTNNKFTISKTGTYTVSITDKNGCISMNTIFAKYIDVCIPNYFTPNGDGINDFWAPGCSTSYKNLSYSIFDRYGRQIGTYRLNENWDGKIDGKELPSGDYWYTLKLNDPEDNREFVGHFTLYR